MYISFNLFWRTVLSLSDEESVLKLENYLHKYQKMGTLSLCQSILLCSSSLFSSLFTKIRTVDLIFNALRARGLRARQEGNEPVAGYFSHIGDLYNVHHFWGKLLNKLEAE